MEIMRMSSHGPNVELLQLALVRAGYYTGELDGLFGPATWRAVSMFQVNNQLEADGIVGPLTWSALEPYYTGYVSHQLVQGDTLFTLANQYATSVHAIATANPGINPANLIPGTTITIPLAFEVVPTNISFTYYLQTVCLQGLKARYPFLEVSVIGESLLGMNIYSVSVGRGQNKVMYNGSHHANEWITTPLLMHYLEDFSATYSRAGLIFGQSAARLFELSTIVIIPMVNPDGVDLVTGVIKPGSVEYRRAQGMNYLNLPFPSGWKANIAGVDLNLNYPAGWEIARQIKFEQGFTSPGPRDYVGPAPLSEPESRAVAEFTVENGFRLTLSYHTQGEVIYWKYSDYLPPGSREIAQLFSMVSGYAYEETPYESGHAGYKDWFIQQFNRPGYTVECGLGINPIHISQFDKIYSDNIGILTLGAAVTLLSDG